jgi:hypothetical protein
MAIILHIVLLQHEKDPKKTNLTNKLSEVEKQLKQVEF